MKKGEKRTIGWREWISLPELGIDKIKAKIDTGARSSSLHAFDLKKFNKSDGEYVKFKVNPEQRNSKIIISCESRVLDYRRIKSSIGQAELRPVIVTNLNLMGLIWPIEITLTNRSVMGFRMLLGRQSFRNRFLVDAGKSYFGNRTKYKRQDGGL